MYEVPEEIESCPYYIGRALTNRSLSFDGGKTFISRFALIPNRKKIDIYWDEIVKAMDLKSMSYVFEDIEDSNFPSIRIHLLFFYLMFAESDLIIDLGDRKMIGEI